MLISRTPFRLPLGGGGTDLPSYYQAHGGFLVTAALGLHMNICMNEPVMLNQIKINYSHVETVDIDKIETIRHEIVRESLKFLKWKKSLEISSMADIASGTGLGSSSSYTVGLLNGLNSLLRRHVSVDQLAEEACQIEMEWIGKPIGKQDQYAAAYGGIISLEINQAGKVFVTRLHLEPEFITELQHRLMIFYTTIQRDANEILEHQQFKILKRNEKKALEAMHRIKQIGFEVRDALEAGDCSALGRLFHKHWMAKKQISEKMSSSQIDEWYELAMNHGALGGKIMGAGGGGFFVFCCEYGKRKHLRSVLENAGLKYTRCTFDFEGSKILGNF
jgi:D-glycero-alpha-D-manno-heptose-7-phosphate kinase